jgi:uncharacterized membrane protein YgcG
MTREGLITDGTEFMLPDGSPYAGPYHVHVSKGAMVGARHVSTPHSVLIAISPSATEKVVKIQNELKQQDFLANAPRVSLSSSGGGGYSGGGGGGGGGGSAPSSSY